MLDLFILIVKVLIVGDSAVTLVTFRFSSQFVQLIKLRSLCARAISRTYDIQLAL